MITRNNVVQFLLACHAKTNVRWLTAGQPTLYTQQQFLYLNRSIDHRSALLLLKSTYSDPTSCVNVT